MAEFFLIIESSYENIKEIVKSIGSFEFQFLDHKYTMNKLFENALNYKIDELKGNVTNLINYHYDDYLNRLKGIIKDFIRKHV